MVDSDDDDGEERCGKIVEFQKKCEKGHCKLVRGTKGVCIYPNRSEFLPGVVWGCGCWA